MFDNLFTCYFNLLQVVISFRGTSPEKTSENFSQRYVDFVTDISIWPVRTIIRNEIRANAAALDYTTNDFLSLYSPLLLFVHIKHSFHFFARYHNSFSRSRILIATKISSTCTYTGKNSHSPSDIDSPTTFYLVIPVLFRYLCFYRHRLK